MQRVGITLCKLHITPMVSTVCWLLNQLGMSIVFALFRFCGNSQSLKFWLYIFNNIRFKLIIGLGRWLRLRLLRMRILTKTSESDDRQNELSDQINFIFSSERIFDRNRMHSIALPNQPERCLDHRILSWIY